MKICVLIPVYNEAKMIGSVVDAAKAKNLDVVVVDDGSNDGSGDLAREKGATVIRHDQKNGKGYSLRQGFDYILQNGYDGIIAMDGDGQHDIGDVDQFLEKAKNKEYGIINGNRMGKTKDMPFLRYLTNRLMSIVISSACRQSIPDTQCGYRYISCGALKAISLKCDDFEIETEILMKASKQGVKILSVPIKTIYSDEESHIHPFKDTIRFFNYFLKEIFTSGK